MIVLHKVCSPPSLYMPINEFVLLDLQLQNLPATPVPPMSSTLYQAPLHCYSPSPPNEPFPILRRSSPDPDPYPESCRSLPMLSLNPAIQLCHRHTRFSTSSVQPFDAATFIVLSHPTFVPLLWVHMQVCSTIFQPCICGYVFVLYCGH